MVNMIQTQYRLGFIVTRNELILLDKQKRKEKKPTDNMDCRLQIRVNYFIIPVIIPS